MREAMLEGRVEHRLGNKGIRRVRRVLGKTKSRRELSLGTNHIRRVNHREAKRHLRKVISKEGLLPAVLGKGLRIEKQWVLHHQLMIQVLL